MHTIFLYAAFNSATSDPSVVFIRFVVKLYISYERSPENPKLITIERAFRKLIPFDDLKYVSLLIIVYIPKKTAAFAIKQPI